MKIFPANTEDVGSSDPTRLLGGGPIQSHAGTRASQQRPMRGTEQSPLPSSSDHVVLRDSLDPPHAWVPTEVLAACRSIWRNLEVPSVRPSIAVTSALRREGRSTVAAGIALVQRNFLGRKTILVELDTASPSLAAARGIRPVPGLAEALRGEVGLPECIVWLDQDLGVLPAGAVGDAGEAMLSSVVSSEVLPDLSLLADAIVADLPPLPPTGAADIVADLFDSVVLVVRAGATPLSAVTQALDALEAPPAVVLNRTASAVPGWLRRRLGR